MRKKQNEEFLKLLVQLTPTEVYGLAKIMGVSFLQDKELKSGEVLLIDILDKFPTFNRRQRKSIIALLREVRDDGFAAANQEEE